MNVILLDVDQAVSDCFPDSCLPYRQTKPKKYLFYMVTFGLEAITYDT